MSSPPPTKPPRGVKQGKETSGLLMSVIRTLSASETNEQREKERAKLEKEYKKSDARLDELVAAHAQEIMEVMQKFSSVSAALTVWGQHCDAAVARLAACRGLLRLRRDDLKRLWMDARTHHYALQMLTDIERVVVSERETRSQLASGRVLAAASTLSAALQIADTTLSHVSALNATRHHLQAKKRELVDVIVKRLSTAVYRGDGAPLSRRISARRRTALLLAELTKSEEVTDAYLQDITPEFEASLCEEDKTFETTVMISLEALGVLDQLKEATEKFKVQIQNELLEVIESISRRIIEEGDLGDEMEGEADGLGEGEGEGEGEFVAESGRPLARLVACLGDEFRACGARNKRLVQLWRGAMAKHRLPDSTVHTDSHYWSAVQQVLQLLLSEYLQIESVTLAAQRSASARVAPTADVRLADYFARKRPPRRTERLFTLAVSSPTSPGSGARGGRAHRYPLVCRPDPAHLHAVLPALHALAADIEPLTGGGECSLRAFISDYVRSGESERLAATARAEIDTAMRVSGAWRERAGRIFACGSAAWTALERAARAAKRCGSCGGAEAARALLSALGALAAYSRAAHHRMAPPGSRAARWLSDDDIVRFLQSLPNWKAAIDPATTDSSAKQELKQAYEREAEILGSSLGDGALARSEINADPHALADVAVLCETMEWLSANIRRLPALAGGGGDRFVSDVEAAALIFDEIAHKCLLFLHLELRIQCFHYVGAEREEDSASVGREESAGGASGLARALLGFHEQASGVLAPRRLSYIVRGLGEMMSAAVIWRWQECDAGTGGARLAALRHCLAALHVPHDGLHRAHAYLHLLGLPPQEIVASVREKGAQFSELEYLNAFKVIGARRGMSSEEMKAQLKQLSAALGHVGVTV